MKPLVVVRYTKTGTFVEFVNDEVDVIYHDEHCKSEPFYKGTGRATREGLRSLVGDGPWPCADDDRSKAINASIEEMANGKPRLKLVPK